MEWSRLLWRMNGFGSIRGGVSPLNHAPPPHIPVFCHLVFLHQLRAWSERVSSASNQGHYLTCHSDFQISMTLDLTRKEMSYSIFFFSPFSMGIWGWKWVQLLWLLGQTFGIAGFLRDIPTVNCWPKEEGGCDGDNRSKRINAMYMRIKIVHKKA